MYSFHVQKDLDIFICLSVHSYSIAKTQDVDTHNNGVINSPSRYVVCPLEIDIVSVNPSDYRKEELSIL